jgi:hypothetical protein
MAEEYDGSAAATAAAAEDWRNRRRDADRFESGTWTGYRKFAGMAAGKDGAAVAPVKFGACSPFLAQAGLFGILCGLPLLPPSLT